MDSVIPFKNRGTADASDPSNLERLEDFFSHYAPLMKSFIHLSNVSEEQTDEAAKEMFVKYHSFIDYRAAKAFAAAKQNQSLIDEDGGAIVLLERFHPAYSADYIPAKKGRNPKTGETIDIPEEIQNIKKTVETGKSAIASADELIKILRSLI